MITSSVLADLSAIFSQINDPRKKRGVRCPSHGVVSLVFLGLLGRITEMAVLARWAEAHWEVLREPLGFTRKKPPCDSRYFAASLDPGSVTASQLQSYVRDHWQVENCLYFVKDRWWDEDRHYTKRPALADCFAAMTNAALSILRLIHPPGKPIRATAEAIQWSPLDVLYRLGFAIKK